MDEKRFLHLVGRKLSGRADGPELVELDELMRQHKELEQLYKSLFSEKVQTGTADRLNAEQAYATHFVKMQIGKQFENPVLQEEVPAPMQNRKYWMMAAAVLLLIVSVLFYQSWSTKHDQPVAAHKNESKNEIVTKKGSKTSIRLPDGTQVWLNADSKITYAENFQGTTREVHLSGEAFFDVVKDKTRPFVIHTSTIDIKVLGTAFNVRSYPNEKNTETSLIRGLVEVTLLNLPGKKIILRPNEKLSVDNSAAAGTTMPEGGPSANLPDVNTNCIKLEKINFLPADSSATTTAWINNKLVFDNEPFEQVASKIERWYNINVLIKDEALKQLRFSGVFEKESLKEVLEALRLTTGRFGYRIQDEQVTIFSK